MNYNNYRYYKQTWIYCSNPSEECLLSKSEVKSLLGKGGLMVRNIFDFDCPTPTDFWYVIKDSFGGIEELPTKVRNQVRKCLKTLDVRMVTKSVIRDMGYEVYIAAMDSYKVKASSISREKYLSDLDKFTDNYEYWGCFDGDKLVAYGQNCLEGNSCNYRTLKAIPEYMKKCYCYYGMIFKMNEYYLKQRGLKFVNDGARSLTEHSNIQPFLEEKFLFRKAYCHLKMHYKWYFGLIVKILYPFRNKIPFASIRNVLKMEEISRNNK